MTRLGLVHSGPYLLYGHNCGLRLPLRLQHAIVGTWNPVACRIWGHDDACWHLYAEGHVGADEASCLYCIRPLAGCTGTGIAHRKDAPL